MKQADPRARFIHDPEGQNQPNDWSTTGITYEGYDLVHKKSINTKEVKLGTKTIVEEINKGHIDRVKMLETLRKYGGQCNENAADETTCDIHVLSKKRPNPKKLENKLIFGTYEGKPATELDKYPYIKELKKHEDKDPWRKFSVLDISTKTTKKNKYIMMAHIMRGAMEKSGYVDDVDRRKYCDATRATLEFAESIKSDVGLCSKINKSRWSGKEMKDVKCDTIFAINDTETLRNYLRDISGNPEQGDASTGQGGGGVMEVFPKTCNYAVVEFSPYIMRRKVDNLLGINNGNNLQNRLTRMSKLLNRRNIRSRRRTYGTPRKYRNGRRFNSRLRR